MIDRYSQKASLALAVPLHAGPLLAGLSGHPVTTVPVFALLMLLAAAAMQRPNLLELPGWINLAALGVGRLMLAAALFGLGYLGTRAFGALPLHEALPLGLSALPGLVTVWLYRDGAEMDVMIDSLIERLDHPARISRADFLRADPAERAVARLIRDLDRLTEGTTDQIDGLLVRLEAEAGEAGFDPLFDAAGPGMTAMIPGNRRIDIALLRYTRRPSLRPALLKRGVAIDAALLFLNDPDPEIAAEAESLARLLLKDGAAASGGDTDWQRAIEHLSASAPASTPVTGKG